MSRSRLGNFLKGRDGAMSWFGIVNLLVGLCLTGLEDNIEAEYFRMVF